MRVAGRTRPGALEFPRSRLLEALPVWCGPSPRSSMLSSPSASGRLLIAASLLVFALTACGRRGPLEPPPDPAAIAAQKQREERRQRQSGARADQAPPQGATAVETRTPPAAQTSRVEGEPPAPEDDDNELP